MFTRKPSVCEQMNRRWGAGLLLCASACVLGCGERPVEPKPIVQKNTLAVETREFAIEGMVCDGCVNNVTSALKAVPGVKAVEVSLKDKKATVLADSPQVSSQMIEDSVSKAGYKAHLITAAETRSPASGK